MLLGGSIDLLVTTPTGLLVIDFKTDRAPSGPVSASHPAYVVQVQTYAELLERLGLAPAGSVKSALLFTETGALVWA